MNNPVKIQLVKGSRIEKGVVIAANSIVSRKMAMVNSFPGFTSAKLLKKI